MRQPDRSWHACLLAGLVIVAWAVPAAAQSQPRLSSSWKQLSTADFTVYSEGSEKDVRDTVARVNAFRAAVHQVFPSAKLDSAAPTSIIVFESQASFTPFKPLSNGRRATWVGGYAMTLNDGQWLVMGRSDQPWDTYQTIFHEYMHYILGRTFASVPLWYGEGVAEVFGSFAGSSRDARPAVGRPLVDKLVTLQTKGLLPVREMLAPNSARRLQNDLTERFYATAWLMAHYLLFDDLRRQGMMTLLRELDAGATIDAAVQTGLGLSVDQLDLELANYFRRSGLLGFTVDVDLNAVPANAARAMTETDVDRLHGDLLVRLGDFDAAERLLQRARGRAPGDDGLLTATARLRSAQERAADAVALFANAPSPRSAESLRAEATALMTLGRTDDAATRLNTAMALGSPSTALLYEVGRVQMARRNWGEATAAFARLRTLDPRPMWDLARAYEACRQGVGQYTAGASRAYIRAAGWADPSSPYAAFAGVLGLLRDKRTDEAASLAADVVAHTADEEWPRQVATFLQGATTAAVLIDRAKSDHERTEAHAYVGLMASIAGRRDEALEHLRWVKTRGLQTLVEYRWTLAELARLESPPAPPGR